MRHLRRLFIRVTSSGEVRRRGEAITAEAKARTAAPLARFPAAKNAPARERQRLDAEALAATLNVPAPKPD